METVGRRRETTGELLALLAGDRTMRGTPEIVEVDSSKLEEALRRAEQSLDPEDYRLFRAIADSYAYVSDLVEDKNASIRRLRKLMFGSRSEKTSEVVGSKDQRPATPAEQEALPDAAQPEEETSAEQADSPRPPKATAATGPMPTPGPSGSTFPIRH